MEEQSEKYVKKYMIAYVNPNNKKIEMLELNSTTLKDALFLSKCLFGEAGPRHLYYKKY